VTETCRYFDSEEWDERLKRHVGRVWDVQDLVWAYKSENMDVSEITGKDTEHIFELDMNDVVTIWRESKHELDDISEDCPHDVENDSLCIFHLPVEEKDDKETRKEFLENLEQGGEENKYLVGAKFGELDLAFRVIESKNENHPIDLRFAEINDLDMKSATVQQQWRISKSIIRKSDFSRADFGSESSFINVDFKRRANFSSAEFREDSYFIDANLKKAFFNHVEFRGVCHFGGVEIEDDSYFIGARFGGKFNFSRAVLGGASMFSEAEFEDDSNFRHVKFKRKADFSGAVFRGRSNFRRAEFDGHSDFEATEFEEKSEFSWTDFRNTCEFNGANFREVSYFGNAYFEHLSSFKVVYFGEKSYFGNAIFEGDSDFRETKFTGGCSFRGTKFKGRSFFDSSELGSRSFFNNAEFNKNIKFTGTILNNIKFEGVKTNRNLINLENATVYEGVIKQPEDSSTFYDFTEATLGDIDIRKENCDRKPFDYFRFYKTDFDGFDFTDYKDELGSSPQIHEFKYTSEDESEEREDRPEELEATYLKAKDGAKKVGDHELASEFFIKEMQYRRERYKDELEEEDLDWKHRAKLEFDRRVNWLYEMTSGYGEKPIRVILTSISVVVLFTFLYPFWGIRQTGDGTARTLSYASASAPAEYIDVIAHSFYFSSVTFTTLGYGDMYPVGLSRILSTVQSATGALLIALLIFVFGRSVKW